MSPRAAWRLESLGFEWVFDYTAGKQDWLAAGLPRAGRLAGLPRAGDVVRVDVPTCRLDETAGEARARARDAGFECCLVVNEQRVVLGVLERETLDGNRDQRAEAVMSAGPSTFRPNVPLDEMHEYLCDHDMPSAWITTNDGVLVGLLERDTLRARLTEPHALHNHDTR